jgi:hypothetical protein
MQHTHWKIAQPCHETLDKMKPTGNGYFCHSCKKNVFDLSLIKEAPAEKICGFVLQQQTPTVSSIHKGSTFLLRWLSTFALFLIPLKKGRSTVPVNTMPDAPEKNKKLFLTKHIMGTVRNAAKRPVRTTVRVTDDHENILAETKSLANGRYRIALDTPAIDTAQLNITAVDTPAYRITLDTAWVMGYPKDIWLNQDIIVTSGVPMDIPIIPPLRLNVSNYNFYNVVIDPEAGRTLESCAVTGAQELPGLKS